MALDSLRPAGTPGQYLLTVSGQTATIPGLALVQGMLGLARYNTWAQAQGLPGLDLASIDPQSWASAVAQNLAGNPWP